MKYIIILWLMLGTLSSFSQTKKYAPPLVESKISSKFGRVSNISFSKRIANFPFSKSVNIKLVSFENWTNGGQIDTTKVVYNEKMPKVLMAVCVNPPKEVKVLNLSQINELTDIWFNYGAIGNSHATNFKACYDPKNAILFLDEKGEVFDFIEICFNCLRMVNFSKEVAVNEECDHKINMIKAFFKKTGITYGVTK
ncbi:hypothetical protein [Nubsella zeaxanthinifaciens]|uniref:hypothetical protein n=1 Tax=Nubsella zeaxanthinifaciens TaxID=392412 RepID=UPI000DE44048|nr:hypothetical protein [Nubsella zeaxanthinifaciens]